MNTIKLWEENISILPNYLVDEMKNLSEKEKSEAFGNELEFGTGGLRGIMGVGSNRMNIYTVAKATEGFANYLIKNQINKDLKVAIGYDNRNLSVEFSKIAATIFSQKGIKVYLYKELTSTPLLSYAVRHFNCDGGIMLTASHNPKEYHGYKVYDQTGAQLNLYDANAVINEISKVENIFTLITTDFEDLILNESIEYIDEEIFNDYLSDIEEISVVNSLEKDLKITFSPIHGTTYKIGPRALTYFGYENIDLVTEQMTPDGDFTNTKSANPEEAESFELAISYAKKNNSDIIIVTDPDGDRLGVMFKQENTYHALTGNQTGALLIKYLIDNKIKKDLDQIIYKTIVTGEMGAMYAQTRGYSVEETLTGFKFIGEKIKDLDNDQKFIFGYEESYGYLISSCVRDKDAIQALVLLSEMANYYLIKGKTLGDILQEIYFEIGYYNEITKSITMNGTDGLHKIKEIMKHFRETKFSDFANFEITKKIDYLNDETGLPNADVLKFYLKDLGWVVFRPSGTEPKIKFYISVKGNSVNDSLDKTKLLYDSIMDLINKI